MNVEGHTFGVRSGIGIQFFFTFPRFLSRTKLLHLFFLFFCFCIITEFYVFLTATGGGWMSFVRSSGSCSVGGRLTTRNSRTFGPHRPLCHRHRRRPSLFSGSGSCGLMTAQRSRCWPTGSRRRAPGRQLPPQLPRRVGARGDALPAD